MLPETVANRLAVYATTYYRVLAPRGWHCEGGEGENGTGYLEVRPSTHSPRVIVYQNAAATYGDILDIACPFFPAAARLQERDFGFACDARPRRETIRRDGKHVVWFRDPAHVSGNGDNSGGRYPAIGAVYYLGGADRTAARVTCVMAPRHKDLCNTIVADGVKRLTTP